MIEEIFEKLINKQLLSDEELLFLIKNYYSDKPCNSRVTTVQLSSDSGHNITSNIGNYLVQTDTSIFHQSNISNIFNIPSVFDFL